MNFELFEQNPAILNLHILNYCQWTMKFAQLWYIFHNPLDPWDYVYLPWFAIQNQPFMDR